MAHARTHSSQRTVRIIFAGLVMVLITACGGGGGDPLHLPSRHRPLLP